MNTKTQSRFSRNHHHNNQSSDIITGEIVKKNNAFWVKSKTEMFLVLNSKSFNEGDQVKGIIKSRGTSNKIFVIKVLAKDINIMQRIDNILKNENITYDFPNEVLKESQKFSKNITAKDKKNREDLSHIAFSTIDGESAKDFDDAVFAQKEGQYIRVMVAIADVSYYVREHTAIDTEAFLRSTSIYYPGHCIPMLPETLSNGLCSLKPNVLRLAVTVSFLLGKRGAIIKPTITPSIIKSHARLTYKAVQDYYDLGISNITKDIKQSLDLLREAAAILRKNRQNRGAIDFDIVESVVALDDAGEPLSIHPQDRLESHKIIEDLMVATNEIVARMFLQKKWPGLFRIHEKPDIEKLKNVVKTAQNFGIVASLPKTETIHPKDVQKISNQYQKSKYSNILSSLMLRAMMQAKYSDKNLGHFGLASDAYAHFTSPIRRYADLLVHRQLRNLLFEKGKKITSKHMETSANHISTKEIKATDIERKIDRIFAATFMASHIKETFLALIVSCTEFGMFVRILEHHVEGLVHISTISNHHVIFLPERMSLVVSKSHEKYMVGDKVKVKLINVNIDKGHIDFELVRSSTTKHKIYK